MDFHILGPLEVVDEGRAVSLGGSRQRALLALLLLHANETLSTDRLIDELWGEHPPPTAARIVHVQISRLRKALAGGGEDAVATVVTRDRGYELTLARAQLDSHRFEDLIADGGRELAAASPDRAAAALERALSLWRGAPLADLAYERFAQSEIARLEELRITALEQLVDAQLALGRHAGVVGRLQALIGEHPYRERLRAQLMLALYRCDRQADALQAYQDARRTLLGELGIEPGERLRELERAILAQDPALSPPAASEPAPGKQPPESPPRPDARRSVSVVCADLAGSAALAERLDPESLHGVLERYSATCAGVLERHGGTAEDFAGDAVVGVFGLRDRHEDDPLRAVRAALELREAGAALGAELERDHGFAVAMRLGIASGEVFVAAGARRELARGDAMNVAAGLAEAAAGGEILLGEHTYRLVAADTRAEQLEPLALRGRRAKVAAWRLLGLKGDGPLPLGPDATPLIARGAELDVLRRQLARAGAEQSCRLVTVVGPPGIGKSRLARELVADAGEGAAVVVGRCLSYGDGIAYLPLAEMIRQLAGPDAERWIAAALAGDDRAEPIARLVLGAIGLRDEPAQAVETFWAVRRLFEAVARERPLLVVVEDAHWADPVLLDLLEYLNAFSSGSPILLLCLARAELLESRPAWAAPQPRGSVLVLEPLGRADSLALVETLAGDELAPAAVGRIVATAEGNPLFLEQLFAVGVENDLATLPPSIEAVLAARIDRLDPAERAALVHASVEGRSFHAGALAELVSEGERRDLGAALIGLVHKQLIRPDRPEFAGEDAFRFAHALIRDAAYGGLPKRRRAELHERVASWLKTKPRVADEILGYHLERAYGYRLELGALEPRDRALAAEAADRLAAAAQAALARGDAAAGARLLERVAALVAPDDPARAGTLAKLGSALVEAGRLADAERVLTEAIERAEEDDDPRVASRARVDQQLERLHAGTSRGVDEARRVADVALRELERHGDDLGRCRAWRLRAWIEWTVSRAGAADEAWRHAALHARRAGDERELFEILGWRASAAVFGPTPVPEAIRRCERIRERVASSPVAAAVTLHPLGLLHAMTGDFDRARRLFREANEILADLGRMEEAVSHAEALVELLAGRPAEAEARLRPGYEELERMGEQPLLATTAAILAQAVYAQDRLDEADALCRVCERIAAAEDVATQALWRGVRAKVRASEGERDVAEALCREAVRLAEATDLLSDRGDALLALAEVLRLAGRATEAEAAARRALELYERKGNLVSASRARSWPTVTAPA